MGARPSVSEIGYDGEFIDVRFSEPVWVSSPDMRVRVRNKGVARCVEPCDGSDSVLTFWMLGLSESDVTDMFVLDSDGSVRDTEGNEADYEFYPYTRAGYPVVIRPWGKRKLM